MLLRAIARWNRYPRPAPNPEPSTLCEDKNVLETSWIVLFLFDIRILNEWLAQNTEPDRLSSLLRTSYFCPLTNMIGQSYRSQQQKTKLKPINEKEKSNKAAARRTPAPSSPAPCRHRPRPPPRRPQRATPYSVALHVLRRVARAPSRCT